MPELLGAHRGVCRNFFGLRGGYAGTFVGLGGICRKFWGLWRGYAKTFGGFGGGMPELLWA